MRLKVCVFTQPWRCEFCWNQRSPHPFSGACWVALGTSLPYWGERRAKGPWGTPGFWSPATAPVQETRALSSSTQTPLARAQMDCLVPVTGKLGFSFRYSWIQGLSLSLRPGSPWPGSVFLSAFFSGRGLPPAVESCPRLVSSQLPRPRGEETCWSLLLNKVSDPCLPLVERTCCSSRPGLVTCPVLWLQRGIREELRGTGCCL